MPNDQEKAALYNLLLVKYRMLVNYGQGLLKRRTQRNERIVNIELGRTDLEMKLLEATLSAMNAGIDMQFPSSQRINELRSAVAKMDQILAQNAVVNDVVAAADELIDAWPDFSM
jgi:hypothetical protein